MKPYKIVLLICLLLCPMSIPANETENFVMLGGFMPVDSDEGLFTPLVYWEHESYGHPLNSLIKIKLETSTLTTAVEHEISDSGFFMGYGLTGTALSESLGTDIYLNGVRQESDTYDGSSFSYFFTARYEFTKKWDVGFKYMQKKTWFDENDDTSSAFVLPPEYEASIYSIILKHKGSFFSEKGSFEFTAIYGDRDDMANWSLDNDAVSKDDYTIQKFKWKIPFEFTKKNVAEMVISGGNGHNLDILNDLDVGGMASEYSAGGFFRTEFRAKRVISANYSHQYHFTKNRRLLLFADLLYFETVDLDYFDGIDRDQTLASLGIGFYYGIESLKGLPVIIRYGEGLNIADESKEDKRREIMILIAAEF